jgi:hypothetical protein
MYESLALYHDGLLSLSFLGLSLAARSEAQVAAYSSQRPSSATSTSSTSLSKIIPSLLTAVEEETDHVQDAFQANTCLGWLHFVLDEPGLAVARLPKNFAGTISSLSSGENKLSGWTQVCFIKGVYLKGMICKCFYCCKNC